ncbi:MAG TPA: START domain-containing protein [Bacteroidales bacterium]|nr:START domain-containing protein [Bacteroidales bacterium]
MSIRKLLLPILAFMLFGFGSYCQKWELSLDKDGVKIYTRAVKGSGIKEFKGEVIANSNLGNILAVIEKISEYPRWMYKCTYAEQVKKVNEVSGYIYSVLQQPWPISDRDICSYYCVSQDSVTKVVTISMKGVKDYIPEKPGKVRVPSLKGSWNLIPIAKGVTKIVYQLHCESGGYIPESIVNAYITDTPYTNLLNLKKIAESPLCPKTKTGNLKEF